MRKSKNSDKNYSQYYRKNKLPDLTTPIEEQEQRRSRVPFVNLTQQKKQDISEEMEEETEAEGGGEVDKLNVLVK